MTGPVKLDGDATGPVAGSVVPVNREGEREKDEEVMVKVTQESSGRHSKRSGSAKLQPMPMRWLTHLFGCWHKKMSPPYTGDGVTYRTCMSCGARRLFDAGRGKMTGSYYHSSPSTLYESRSP
jgi:hypothetical protein